MIIGGLIMVLTFIALYFYRIEQPDDYNIGIIVMDLIYSMALSSVILLVMCLAGYSPL